MSPDSRNRRPDGPGGIPARDPHPGFPPSDPGFHGHTVRFYRSDASLAGAVADFLAPALSAGHAALVLASPELRQSLREALPGRGIDADAAVGDGRLHLHDARGILDRILSPSGLPDEDQFMRVIGGLIAKASADRADLRAFTGISALPWALERPDAALELERLWGVLGRTLAFSLLCAYPLRGFRAPDSRADAETFARVCEAHDSAIPCEPFRADAPEAERMRQVAELQLRLAELETEPVAAGWTAGDPRRDLPDAVPVLMWSAGPDGRRDFVNRAWLEFTGNGKDRELGRGFEGVHPDDRESVAAAYGRALEGRAPFHTEFRYRRRDGAWRWFLNTASPRLDADGAFLGFAGVCVDITERKEAEARARQAVNLESLGRLAGGLAHDFNNLLTAINGYSEISLSLAPEEGPLHDFLAEIRGAGERATELTRQLLSYGRKQVLSATVFDLNGTLDDLEPVARRLLGEGIRLERAGQAGLGRVLADPGQTQQLILGLLVNARDAMPGGGTIFLETADVLARSDADGSPRPYVRLSVRDTGPGMAPEVMARVFEPFFTTKKAGAGGPGRMGAGMGLASAYGLARQSGGFLSVERASEGGSIFRLHLPWIEPEAGKDARLGPAGGSAAIGIAAGEESLRRFLARSLAAEGYAIRDVSDEAAAAPGAEAASFPVPDLLIAEDPSAGFRASALAARSGLRPPARVFSIPASSEAMDLPPLAGAGAVMPLELPVSRMELLDRVRQVLGDRDPGIPEVRGNRSGPAAG